MTDVEIYKKMEKHWDRALELYPRDRIIGLWVQGSQNYHMEYEDSDVDTKLLIVPSFEDIVLNRKPVSTTHILDNDEHMDAKDIRLYWQTLKKGNINFVELLFARVAIINPKYAEAWSKVDEIAEDIAYMDPLTSAKAMMGMVNEKYFAMTHRYPSRVEWIDRFGGYDPKQLHHLARITIFLEGYAYGGYKYVDLLEMENKRELKQFITEIKWKGHGTLEEAQAYADEMKARAEAVYNRMKEKVPAGRNPIIDALMDEYMAEIVKIGIKEELM
jgi:hypothetical protein